MGLAFKAEQTKKDFTITIRNYKEVETEVPGTFIGDIQPVTGSDIESSEARLELGMIKVYSEDKLVVPQQDVTSAKKGTYVLFKSKWYEVTQEDIWQTPDDISYKPLKSLDHYKYYGTFRETNTI